MEDLVCYHRVVYYSLLPWIVLYFQAVTVLVRDVKMYKLEETQLQVLLTFCEEDLYDYNRQSTAFSLLKVQYWCTLSSDCDVILN